MFSFLEQMKSVNVFEYFPIKNDDMLTKFMKKDDDFDDRMEQLHSILLPTVTETQSRFGTAVLNSVFHLDYIVSHRWPTLK